MSDSFKWLEDIVKARTEGEWLRDKHKWTDVIDVGARYAFSLQYRHDARFIATMGTLADQILAVIKAADKLRNVFLLPDDASPQAKSYLMDCCIQFDKALDTLQAAKDNL